MSSRPSPGTIALALLAGATITVAVGEVGATAAPTSAATRVVAVRSATVRATVAGTGALAPAERADLGFDGAGTIEAISVRPGDHVTKGQLLARLDDSQARSALEEAQAALSDATTATAESTVGATAATATPTQTPDATGEVATAARVTVTPTATATATATATPTAADDTCEADDPTATPTPTPTPTPSGADDESEQSTDDCEPSSDGDAGDEAVPSPSPAPATEPDPAAPASPSTATGQGAATAPAQVDTARLQAAVEQARAAVRATRLRATMGGTVTTVTAEPGEAATAGATVFTIADVHRYVVDVAIDEADIGRVEVGQKATVAVSAVAGLELAGTVTSVGVVPDEDASSVAYPVTVELDRATPRARAGMTATAEIVVGRARGLSVPNEALQGQTVTTADGNTTRVAAGLAGDERTIVTSGLEAGDRVVVTSASAAAGAAAALADDGEADDSGASPQVGLAGGGFAGRPPSGGPPSGGGPPGAGAP